MASVAAGAERDRDPAFPARRLAPCARPGLTTLEAPPREQWRLVRAVARADGSVGAHPRRSPERGRAAGRGGARAAARGRAAAVAEERRAAGRLGRRPGPGEGEPARLDGDTVARRQDLLLGRRGVDGRARAGPRGDRPGRRCWPTWTCPRASRSTAAWFRGAGMRASESHRVVFDGAPVLAVLGGPGEIAREPYFGRDAIRTAAMLGRPGRRGPRGGAGALARGPPTATSRRWRRAGWRRAGTDRRAGSSAPPPRSMPIPAALALDLSMALRAAVADAAGTIIDEAGGLRLAPAGGRRPAGPRAARPGAVPPPAPPGSARGQARRRALGGVSAHRGRARAGYFDACTRPTPTRGTSRPARTSATSTPTRWPRSGAARSPGRSRWAARSGCSREMLAGAARAAGRGRVAGGRGAGARRATARAERARRAAPRCPRRCRPGPFDLIVCSEVLYYWDRGCWARRWTRDRGALAPGGSLLAVHWRPHTRVPAAGRRGPRRCCARAPTWRRSRGHDAPTTGWIASTTRMSPGAVVVSSAAARRGWPQRGLPRGGRAGPVTILAAEPQLPTGGRR